MNKEEVLKSVKELADKNMISKKELNEVFSSVDQNKKKNSIIEVLYYLGGLIVVFGIIILITKNWYKLNSVIKILSTLGSGIVVYLVAVFFRQYKKLKKISSAFYLMSALILPIGLFVIFKIANFDIFSYGTYVIIFAILSILYSLSYIFDKTNKILLLFSIIFATFLYYTVMGFFFGESPLWEETYFVYFTLLAGVVYILLGYLFRKTSFKVFTKPFYNLGTLLTLSSTMYLGGYRAFSYKVPLSEIPLSHIMKMVWEIAFPFLTFFFVYLSVRLKNKRFLDFGVAFFMGYIIKITAEYFSDSLGWPLALVIIGLLMIFLGYSVVNFRKKYFKRKINKN